MTDAEAQLYNDLAALGIVYEVYEHPAVFTVAESSQHNDAIPGAHTKNFFLKDKAGKYFLVTVPADARVDLKALPAAIGCGRVSFGKAEDMEHLIGVTPGSVTALAIMNDSAGEVGFVLDASLMEAELINCHPLRNTATLGLAPDDLVRAVTFWRHPPFIRAIPIMESV
ncbi:prolyl-tRNA synthetase associated domain-containing protein [Sphingorhabdus sp.]|uniref:prolyl-tRNA synthetase associated domain-containing protein n=1 Tax=Sphingorhabdus sp. TaxID=1902408 RepID=UPI00391DC43D